MGKEANVLKLTLLLKGDNGANLSYKPRIHVMS